jgi:hypothetical protein
MELFGFLVLTPRSSLQNKESFGLIPGGFHEATIAYPGTSRVFLKNRKGE